MVTPARKAYRIRRSAHIDELNIGMIFIPDSYPDGSISKMVWHIGYVFMPTRKYIQYDVNTTCRHDCHDDVTLQCLHSQD